MEREVMVDARHPLVAPLYAAFQDRLYLYLDMEYCPGGSLDNFVGCVESFVWSLCCCCSGDFPFACLTAAQLMNLYLRVVVPGASTYYRYDAN